MECRRAKRSTATQVQVHANGHRNLFSPQQSPIERLSMPCAVMIQRHEAKRKRAAPHCVKSQRRQIAHEKSFELKLAYGEFLSYPTASILYFDHISV